MRLPVSLPFMRLRRWGFLGLVAATTGAGGWMMLHILGGGGFTALEALILVLFLPTFAWIVIPFWTTVAGFVLRILGRDPLTLGPDAAGRAEERPHDDGGTGPGGDAAPPPGSTAAPPLTALAVPIYNEDPEAVSARISAMVRSLRRAGGDHRFHVHILSDTSDPAIAREEEGAWVRLQAEHPEIPIHYRRRARNQGRKAGNIGEFCRRCVDDYAYMVVLDADSLMTGETLLELVAMMEADPGLGLVQTVPLPVRQRTLFGRLVQFAGCLYGPMLAAGQAFWQGDDANYWGHNAILRLRPFAEHGGLPVLPGRPPLGGEILSHDFVEAAFLRRAGWKVLLHPTLGGSWEEVPGTVVDYARRDRRWAQGSLQHLRLLLEPGLHPLSRLHFFLGAMGYVSSLLWLLTLLAGTAYVLLPVEGLPAARIPLPGGPAALSLLAVTGVILFLPKLLGVVQGLVRERRRFGGGVRLAAGAVLETLFSVLLAPVMMLYHARFVVGIALGRTVEWDPQEREGAILPWSRALRAGGWAMAVGVAWGGITLALSPLFFLWMSPIFAGLLLAVPLLRWSSSPGLGLAARDKGLLLVPTETRTVPVVGAVDWMLRREEATEPEGSPRVPHSAPSRISRGPTGFSSLP